MNPLTNVRNTQNLNKRELELGLVGTKSSWHDDFKDSAWIFVGGLPYELSEGDILAVFSQYGEIVNLNLVRDRQSGKSKGFGFICYEDQRSTILAVDNFNSIKLLNRTLRVNHVADYKVPKEHGDEDDITLKLREAGCAPQVQDPEDQEATEPVTLSKTSKKEKKKKKKKEKKKKSKKRKEESASDTSESSVEESVKGHKGQRSSPSRGHLQVKSERADRGYHKYEQSAPAVKKSRRYSSESGSDTEQYKTHLKVRHQQSDSSQEERYARRSSDVKIKVEKDYTVHRGRQIDSREKSMDHHKPRSTEFTKDYAVKQEKRDATAASYRTKDYRGSVKHPSPDKYSREKYDDDRRGKKRKEYGSDDYEQGKHEAISYKDDSKRHFDRDKNDSSDGQERKKSHPPRDDYRESRDRERGQDNRDFYRKKERKPSRQRHDTDSSDNDSNSGDNRQEHTEHNRYGSGRKTKHDRDGDRRPRRDSRERDTRRHRQPSVERQRGRHSSERSVERQRGRHSRERSDERGRDRERSKGQSRERSKMKIVVEIHK